MSDNQSPGRKLPRRKTCERYGVCDRTVRRWELDPDLNFPQPTIINRRKYDDEHQLDAWDRANSANVRTSAKREAV